MIIIHNLNEVKMQKSKLYTDLYTFSTEKSTKIDEKEEKTGERMFC